MLLSKYHHVVPATGLQSLLHIPPSSVVPNLFFFFLRLIFSCQSLPGSCKTEFTICSRLLFETMRVIVVRILPIAAFSWEYCLCLCQWLEVVKSIERSRSFVLHIDHHHHDDHQGGRRDHRDDIRRETEGSVADSAGGQNIILSSSRLAKKNTFLKLSENNQIGQIIIIRCDSWRRSSVLRPRRTLQQDGD